MAGTLGSIETCIPALRRYASFLLRGPQDADDLVHDTLVRALDKMNTRRGESEIRPWLFSIMHNLFVSDIRKARVRRNGLAADAEEVAVRGVQEDNLHWRDVMRALNSLPAEQRSVILLVSVEDLSYAEVALVLDVPIGTVMSRLSRGRERLRELASGDAQPALRRVK
jgi:RNA polymerase sigma-70 factor (ECF subfamily)